ncbi:rho guanine nucleotide exchange factor 19 isoform X2 [Microcaecilia unicolor]|uniref:Rho guanine nucleotide exchange factor 19-like isoform X2 n=1 Tax=Microcaecilia unicolor TaxID=1415580 RepID=A0A6P7WNF2_9AMPH|nr:rho guanine nucleotide exchange factor 19-like isoform X2 [Microcaecilia unicolor]
MEYQPLPDFQPHFNVPPFARESGQMQILAVSKSEAREDINNRSCGARHPIAVYRQDSLSFSDLPELQRHVQTEDRLSQHASDETSSFSTTASSTAPKGSSQEAAKHLPLDYKNNTDKSPTGGPRDCRVSLVTESGNRDCPHLDDLNVLHEPLGVFPPQGRQVIGKADSWPHEASFIASNFSPSSCSDSSLSDAMLSPWTPRPQRRASQGSDHRKSTWRKIRIYSPESLGDGTPHSDSLQDDDSVFSPPCVEQPKPLLECLNLNLDPSLSPAVGRQTIRGSEQERRRFSASELISKLQLAQRRATFSIKLSKSLSTRVTVKDKSTDAADQEGRNRRQRSWSSAGSEGIILTSARESTSSPKSEPLQEREPHEASLSWEYRQSRFLQTSVLYQEYSDVAINREIQRQKREDTLVEDDDITPPKANLSPTSSFRSQCSPRGSTFSLWQDIPDVRGSGLLGTLSNQERKLQEAKFELITSEASYIRSLSIAVDHFLNSPELNECLGTQEKQWLFSKLPEVKDVSDRFLLDLEERLEEDILHFDVCDIVLQHCPEFRRVYLPYVTNQAYQEQTYQRLLLENPKFPSILAKLEEDQVCQRLPLTSFLILPFQRIMRLKMLVENILKQTAPGSRDEDTATRAFKELKKLVKECNASVQSMKRTEELIHLNKKIHFESKIFPLISQSRWLVKHGELVELDMQLTNTSGSKVKLSSKAVYLHLFNDCLLLSRRKEMGKFAVFVYGKMPELRVKDLSWKLQGVPGHVFHLQLLDKQQLKHQILLRAQTESEKQRWISAMIPSSPQLDAQHLVENEDILQVQCIKAYKAQEHDELSLEKADILRLKTKTSDGEECGG